MTIPNQAKEEKPLRVLVVEDSENDTILLLRELRKAGYTSHYKRVETEIEMRDALDVESWDIVISDHSMLSAVTIDLKRGCAS